MPVETETIVFMCPQMIRDQAQRKAGAKGMTLKDWFMASIKEELIETKEALRKKRV